jgi:hypothetical protein
METADWHTRHRKHGFNKRSFQSFISFQFEVAYRQPLRKAPRARFVSIADGHSRAGSHRTGRVHFRIFLLGVASLGGYRPPLFAPPRLVKRKSFLVRLQSQTLALWSRPTFQLVQRAEIEAYLEAPGLGLCEIQHDAEIVLDHGLQLLGGLEHL